jgi:hypothetical protein
LNLKLLLKRGALVAAANWQIIAIQFAAETTFQVLLAVPIIGAAILVAALLGGDLAELLRGNLREMFTTIAGTLMSEPVALVAFIAAFTVVLLGGSVLMFVVKGGTVDVLLTAEASAGPIEQQPLSYHLIAGEASRFSLDRFLSGCRRLHRRYVALGFGLMLVYAVSGGAFLAFVAYGYQAVAGRLLFIGWIFNTALATFSLVVWITFVNWWYLLLQIAMATEDLGVGAAVVAVSRFIRAELRELAGMFAVILGVIVAATLASALAWSGVGLIAFVPLVGLAVFPLQIAALLVRGLVFEYIGLSALAAYATLYHRYLAEHGSRVSTTDAVRRWKAAGDHA